MSMRRSGLLFVIIGCLFASLAAAQQQSCAGGTSQGRFQLLGVVVEPGPGMGEVVRHELFLLDSTNGHVWRYQEGGVGKKPDGTRYEVPEFFVPIEFFETQSTGAPSGGTKPSKRQ